VDSETARFLNGYTPASQEAAVLEIALRTSERVLPPKHGAPTMAKLAENPKLLRRYGMEEFPGADPLHPERG